MNRYAPERKEAILKKLAPPNSMSIAEVAEQEGISQQTLYHWRKQAREQGQLMPNQTDEISGHPSLFAQISGHPSLFALIHILSHSLKTTY
ncbi:transposase [Motilimonas cestriensis]|uniref:Transposase n=1 Tax=Motilimonas cestriensis TaxID=2742685 RepID=A0ABS8WI35_9GAMM|nr:transposase [Motilimonas cestriensis]